jgi:hypothetical protein
MKTFAKTLVFVFCFSFLFSTTSCVVLMPQNAGKHKGWVKNQHNPHHPNTIKPDNQKKKGRK